MSGGTEFFELPASEDIDGDEMDLCVTPGLGGGHVDNLAGAVHDHNEAVLSQGRALHRKGGRGAGIGGFEGLLMLLHPVSLCNLVARKLWMAKAISMRPGGALRGDSWNYSYVLGHRCPPS